ncbi:hypothetical protein Hanom_Chr07g00625121 [Helianthus anomalus]
MAMGIYRQGSLSGGELGREIPSALRGTVQLPFNYTLCHSLNNNRFFPFSFLFLKFGSKWWLNL